MIHRSFYMLLFTLGLALSVQQAQAHCQLPCGVYDDGARIAKMREDVRTIAKANSLILDDATPEDKKIRSVLVKEDHAASIDEIAVYYFMTQRIKADADKRAEKIAALHDILLASMKAKQSTDDAPITALNAAIDAFEALYMPKDDHGHKH